MAASDPTPYVATPTGALQGVAAFSWDGSAWQPSGRAGPDVATPTGTLQGVTPFSWSGSAWTPAGRAQPGVATPTGVLDGVAVYTWSGSAWTPASGTATPSTPSGALRGVAAFSWDGSAWQPAAQARASVPTPYGVLDGVAFFNWGGSTWQAGGAVPAGATLDLSFLSGTLDPRITFTRASTATYFDATGTIQTAITNGPRFDYDPATHALRGLLIEEARTNIALQSSVGVAPWASFGSAGNPVMTANSIAAPDGTISATRIDYGAVSGGGANAFVYQNVTVALLTYVFSVWLKGAVGGEQIYLNINFGGASFTRTSRLTLTTQWQRFFCPPAPLSVNAWTFAIGADLRDGSQTATPAQTIYAWGGQVEQGGFATSYIPTTGAGVTRAGDVCYISNANMSWFTPPGGSWSAEFVCQNPAPGNLRVIDLPSANNRAQLYVNSANLVGISDAVGTLLTGNALTTGAISKAASTWASPNVGRVCLNGAAIASSSALTTGFPDAASWGTGMLGAGVTNQAMTGYMRRFRYWPRVLSDAELQSVTT